MADFEPRTAQFLTGKVLNRTRPPDDWDMEIPPELERVSRRLPELALFSGRTAAWLHGLELPPCNPIEVTMPMNSQTSHLAGVRLMRSNVADGEAVSARGLRVTSVMRTVADVARRQSLVESVVIFDIALHRRLVTFEQLQTWIAKHRGYRGIETLRQAIELAEPTSESPMETRLRLLLVLSGLPKPRVQVALYDNSGMFLARPDLFYPNKRLVIEYDGATHRDSLAGDNRRQNRLLEEGYRVLRSQQAI